MENIYVQNGAVPPESKSYIERPIEEIILQRLKCGCFCALYAPRQMGKSSLLLNLRKKIILDYNDKSCIIIDLQNIIDSTKDLDKFYQSFLYELFVKSSVSVEEMKCFFEKHQQAGKKQLINIGLKELILPKIPNKLFLFIDEIECSLNRKLHDPNNFFTIIRSINFEQKQDEIFKKLVFLTTGVALHCDFFINSDDTPYNCIAEDNIFKLENFNIEEIKHHFGRGFKCSYDSINRILEEIFFYTNGNPILTQRICYFLSNANLKIDDEKELVKSAIEALFLSKKELVEHDIHFMTIQKRIIDNQEYNYLMIEIYEKIYNKTALTENEIKSKAILYLKLTGIISFKNNKYQLNSFLYEKIYNQKWIDNIRKRIYRPHKEEFILWENNNKSKGYLLTGEKLDKTISWYSNQKLTDSEFEYIEKSKNQRIKHKRNTLVRFIVFFATALLFVSAILLYYYTTQKEKQEYFEITTKTSIEKNAMQLMALSREKFNQYKYNEALTLASSAKYILKSEEDSIESYLDTLKKINTILLKIKEEFQKHNFDYIKSLYIDLKIYHPSDRICLNLLEQAQNTKTVNELMDIPLGTIPKKYLKAFNITFSDTINKYQILKHEVTNIDYALFLNVYGSYLVKNGEYSGLTMITECPTGLQMYNGLWVCQKKFNNYPVVDVTWYGAKEYCDFFNYDLPTDAEFIYAIAYSEKEKPFDATKLETIYNIRTNDEELESKNVFRFGDRNICDLIGNVSEWTNDSYKIDEKIYRGGSYNTNKNDIFKRFSCKPRDRTTALGFRYVKR